MGRSAELTGRGASVEAYDPPTRASFTSGPFELRVERTAAGVTHRVKATDPAAAHLPEYVVPADVTIGSGARGRSYLAVQGGAVWQTPISWYVHQHKWNLSPGFNLGNGGRWAIHTDCLFCHVDRVEPILGSANRYREPLFPGRAAIGCERCHGPGELHVAERGRGAAPDGADTSIVNPRHLPPDLRAGVCEQCHLGGQERVARYGRDVFEFRPGLPFEQFVTVFVRHPDLADAKQTGGQFEQMEASRCFAASGGKMGCVTCHDPHAAPPADGRDRFYRARCLSCHESRGCTLPAPKRAARADSCVACHMPRGDSSNIAHASVTDHRILRRPGSEPARRGLPPGAAPLVAYRTGPHAAAEPDRERDLGIALTRLAVKVPPHEPAVREQVAGLGIDRLTAALARSRGDAQVWTALATARGLRGEPEARFEAATAAVRLAPELEKARTELAEAATALGKFDLAVEAASPVIRMNPTAVEPYTTRAAALARLGRWKEAEEDCRAALRIHPLHPLARVQLGVCLHHLGDTAGGRREAEAGAGLATSPQQRAALLDWYRREAR
jgi:hypothetical protein